MTDTSERRPSLLWPPDREPKPATAVLDVRAIDDLDLHDLIRALSGYEPGREKYVTAVLSELNTDPAVIVYRQEALADLLDDSVLCDRLHEILPRLTELIRERGVAGRHTWVVAQIAERLEELEAFIAVAVRLRQTLDAATLRSPAMRGLHDHLVHLTDSSQFRSLQREAPLLREQLDQARSVSIGINLSRGFYPESAAILSLNQTRIEGQAPLLSRLFGQDGPRAITPLFQIDTGDPRNPLYRELRKLLEAVAAPVAQALRRYVTVNAYALNDLEPELSFLLNAAALVRRLQRGGLPVSTPALLPSDERAFRLAEGYNVGLALRLVPPRGPEAGAPPDPPAPIVTNPMSFDDQTAHVWILTGPNRGGKTTYTRAVGLTHVLAQAGLCVPARDAALSPVDAIYSHFPSPESDELGHGKLDEEASRLARIFAAATPHSLVLLNEVLAGTSAIEALGLAMDAVRGLRLLGTRAIYTTHLHELAARVDEINASTPGDSVVGSLVAAVEDEADGSPPANGAFRSNGRATQVAPVVIGPRHRRTFRILPGPPRGVSYASEIAEQHGISYAQLAALFRERGVVPAPAADEAAPVAAPS